MAIGDAPNDIYHNGNFYNRNGTQVSGISDLIVVSSTRVMTNGDIIFTAQGDVTFHDLVSECITANDATLTTVQYSITPTVGSATAISGVSGSLASVTAGTIVTVVGDALTTSPTISATGVGLSQAARGIFFPSGTLTLVIATGPTTGTWRHYLRYSPAEPGAVVV
jgi:hypothetical protein